MTDHQYTQQPKKTDNTSQKQAIPPKQIPISHPAAIVQRARINPKSLTHADVMQLQRTIGNKAVGMLLSEIGLIPSKAKQTSPVQMQTIAEEEKEPLQGKMLEIIQRQEIPEEEPLQGKFAEPIQRQEVQEEEEPLQGKFEDEPEKAICPSCPSLPIQQAEENRTGLPDNLKAGVENLSGIDISDVRVHYNSDNPSRVGALAYTQGTDIHMAPGQERHLPHEAWHVVQQAQGRVKPIMQLKDGIPINDDKGLEHEADLMGEKAFTSGQDMFFRQGAYQPGSRWGKELIAPELTHVMQQNVIPEIIQRITVNLDETDEIISSAVEIELKRQQNVGFNYQQAILAGNKTSPLARIGKNEMVTVLAHGEPEFGGEEPRVGGRTAQELFNLLVQLGLSPGHTGDINLSNCTTAWNRHGNPSFAERLRHILHQNGYKNAVTGFRSFVSSKNDNTEEEVNLPDREYALAIFLIRRCIYHANKIGDAHSENDITGDLSVLRRQVALFENEARILQHQGAGNDGYMVHIMMAYLNMVTFTSELIRQISAGGNRARLYEIYLEDQAGLVMQDLKNGTGANPPNVPAKRVRFQ